MKKLLAVFAGLTILVILAALILPFVIDLNAHQARYLPMLEERLNRKVILKDLRLTLLPRLGVRIKGFTIMDDPLFGTAAFATLGSLDLGLKLRPLLSGRVEVGEIIIRDPTILVIKNSLGLLNVSTLGKKGPPLAQKPGIPSPPRQPLEVLSLLAVDRLSLTDGQLNYIDRSSPAPNEYLVKKLQVLVRGVGLGLTPVLHMNATVQPFNLPVRVDGSLGPLTENLDLAAFIFDIAVGKAFFELRGDVVGGTTRFAVSSPGITTGDLPLRLALIRPVSVKDIHVTGEIKDSQLNIGSLDVLIPLGRHAVTVKGSSINGETKLKFTAPVVNTADLPVLLPLKKPIEITDLQVAAELEPSHAHLRDTSFRLFGGQVRGQGELKTGAVPAPFNGKVMGAGLQLGPVMDVLGTDKVSISGTASADLKFEGKGFSMPELISFLEGTGHLSVRDGKIEGMNLLQEAAALLKAMGFTRDLGAATVFSAIDSNLKLQRGVVTVESLKMDSPDFQATGNGTISFDKSLNMRVTLSLSESLSKEISGISPLAKVALTRGRISVPMLITGTTQAPVYALDTKAVGTKLQEQVQEKLGDLLKGKGGEEFIKQGGETLRKLFGQ
jgi:AsmA protein